MLFSIQRIAGVYLSAFWCERGRQTTNMCCTRRWLQTFWMENSFPVDIFRIWNSRTSFFPIAVQTDWMFFINSKIDTGPFVAGLLAEMGRKKVDKMILFFPTWTAGNALSELLERKTFPKPFWTSARAVELKADWIFNFQPFSHSNAWNTRRKAHTARQTSNLIKKRRATHNQKDMKRSVLNSSVWISNTKSGQLESVANSNLGGGDQPRTCVLHAKSYKLFNQNVLKTGVLIWF